VPAGPGFRTSARRRAALLLTGFLLLGLGLPFGAGRAQQQDVDLALILAVDCSYSVDSREFLLQMQGLAQAFLSPEVQAAISGGARQRIAVAVVQWSDDRNQHLSLPWTLIATPADAQALAARLAAMPRQLAEGGTSISAALAYSEALFARAPAAARRVIDVSTDGRNNNGPPVSPMRDRLVAQGITINGLTILNDWPTLNHYFEQRVAGGEGHFVIPADDYEAYAQAILRKLLREITGPGIS